MVRSFRFLLNFAWVNLGAIIGFAAIVIGGCYATGVPNDPRAGNLFETYYAMFPTMILLCLFLYAFALCTNNLNLGLSMGARRGDFFWAIQGIMVFYSLICWVLQWFMSAFPAIANWEVRERFSLLSTYSAQLWIYPMLCMVVLVLGCLSGLLIVKSKVLGTIVLILSIFLMIGVTVMMLLSTDMSFRDFFFRSYWNNLPKILAGVLAVSFVGGEFLIWRTVQRYVVR